MWFVDVVVESTPRHSPCSDTSLIELTWLQPYDTVTDATTGSEAPSSRRLTWLILMIWMNTVSQVLFYGAELCKVVARRDGYAAQDNRFIERPGGVSPSQPVDRRVSQPRRRAG